MSEQVIKLNEKRYSLRTVEQVIGLHEMTVYSRAKKLGIDTSRGLTAEDVKRIKAVVTRQTKKHSAAELREELEELK
jgi:hypothetical protein